MARKKRQSRKYTPRNEFRRNTSKTASGHFDYVFGETKTQYKSIGLTHSPTADRKYYPLTKNPNPKDDRQSYIHLNVRGTNKKFFKAPEKGWEFAKEDMPVVRHTIKQYKKSTNRKPKNWYSRKKSNKK
ncbi:MAG TPA: hypothetical protein DDY77_02085 [Clostridiales bacterium]|nr:hypothetical protein [Clostridiales bacterium]